MAESLLSQTQTQLLALYEEMCLIRTFEERVLALFSEGKLHGTTHCYIGQEAVAAGLFWHLTADDVVWSNHRCHGHYLMHQRDPEGLMAELMGRAGGACGGRGGSQHLCRGNFYSNGVQGGIVPAALGMALARRCQGSDSIVVVFLGDGTMGEGQVYEAMNIASLWNLPVLFVIENNHYSQSTPAHLHLAGRLADRPRAFGIETFEVASNDVLVTCEGAAPAVRRVRRERRPAALIFDTFRLCSHSRSDDGRPESVIAPWRQRDPLLLAEARLPAEEVSQVRRRVAERVEQAVRRAQESPPAAGLLPPLPYPEARPGSCRPGEKVVTALNRALHELLATDPRVLVLGEDILDPYGGAFKVVRGLSTAFPERVLTTPVSEACLAGMAGGLALAGMRPVLEIMFGDFLALCTDQMVNYISKYRGMYNDQVRCPLVVRTPMGGRRGYGPTHSQSLEKLLLGLPDVRLVALSAFHDPQALLATAVADEAPVVLLENKLLYTRPLRLPDEEGWVGDFAARVAPGPYPAVSLSPVGFRRADLALATYGGMAELALQAAEELLMEYEVACEVVVFSEIYPLRLEPLGAALERSRGRLLTAEEGILAGGWGAEVAAACASKGWLRGPVGRVGARPEPIPSAPSLEEQVLPGVADLIEEARRILG